MPRTLRILTALAVATCGACGRIPPTAPVEACPPTESHYVRSDTSYFVGTHIPAVVTDVYACSVDPH